MSMSIRHAEQIAADPDGHTRKERHAAFAYVHRDTVMKKHFDRARDVARKIWAHAGTVK